MSDRPEFSLQMYEDKTLPSGLMLTRASELVGHTPGPWFIRLELAMQREDLEQEEIDDELCEAGDFGIYSGDPLTCTRSTLTGYSAHICDIDPDEDFGNETALANARLIAAAPELLTACEVSIFHIESFLGARNPAVIAIRAAISKATGDLA